MYLIWKSGIFFIWEKKVFQIVLLIAWQFACKVVLKTVMLIVILLVDWLLDFIDVNDNLHINHRTQEHALFNDIAWFFVLIINTCTVQSLLFLKSIKYIYLKYIIIPMYMDFNYWVSSKICIVRYHESNYREIEIN